MKTPLGTKVDLAQATLLDEDPAPPAKGAQQPLFSLMSIVATVAHPRYC